MPSRKRLAGKARRARASQTKICKHGLIRQAPDSDSTLSQDFVGSYAEALEKAIYIASASDGKEQEDDLDFRVIRDALGIIMTELTTKYEDIWTNDTEREIVIHFLAYYGTKKLLMMDASSDNDADDDIKYLCPAANAGAILWLENKGTFKTDGYNEFLKFRDITEVCKRSIIKFYSQRIPCSCLDQCYSKVKQSQPKSAVCDNCLQRLPRRSLSFCAGCRAQQYCGRDCQQAAWSIHGDKCKILKERRGQIEWIDRPNE